MPHPALSAAVARARRAVARPPDADDADGQLLARFARTRDDGAFAELVRRLGPMVLGVCRRLAGDDHLAEDAFQAAFLVLARRPEAVRAPGTVGGWLYGVAVRLARKARAMSARRHAREVPVPSVPDHASEHVESPDADALRALDEEVAALPDHLRAAVVTCELGGATRADAAARLGVPAGTLSSRLARARKLLTDRLRKRGVELPAAGLAVLGHAAVPPRLAAKTSALATSAGPVPPAVSTLSNGEFRTMFLHKLAVGLGCGLALAAACLAAWAAPSGAAAGEPPAAPRVPLALAGKPADEKKVQPAAKPAGPGTLLLARKDKLVALTPEGKEGDELTAPKDTGLSGAGWLSPDGTRAAFLVTENQPPSATPPADPWLFKVVVHKLGADKPSATIDVPSYDRPTACWSPDGKKLAVSKMTAREPDVAFEDALLDPETGKTEKLDLPDGTRVLDWSRDGKTFLVQGYDPKAKKSRLGLAAPGGKEVTPLCDLRDHPWFRAAGRLSPDGKRVLFIDADPEDKDARKWGRSGKPYLVDVGTKKREALGEFPGDAQCIGVAWSPDGKKVAYTWVQLHPEVLKKDELTGADVQVETEAFLVVADADGKNAKTVASAKSANAASMIFGTIDWR
jgi:RNA polymerase sigma factor (sigma-70 family)